MAENKLARIGRLLSKAKIIAKQYREVTGKPLGITGEVAEYEATRLLGLESSVARQPGYDAIRSHHSQFTKIQIKGRRIPEGAKPGQRVGSIRLEHDWDTVVLVMLDDDFEPVEMYKAARSCIKDALNKPGSIVRNIRGSLSVSKFKSISRLAWSKEMYES